MSQYRQPYPSRSAIATVAICAILAFVLIIAPSLLEGAIRPGAKNAALWLYWLKVVSGNWDPSSRDVVGEWAFSFSAILSVLLNNALIIVVPGLIWRFILEWRTRMLWKQAFLTRDEMFYQSVITKFSQDGMIDAGIEAKINEAFNEGAKLWQKHVIAIFGVEEASKLFSLIEKNSPVGA
jgi:hypothetical protein